MVGHKDAAAVPASRRHHIVGNGMYEESVSLRMSGSDNVRSKTL